VLAFLTEDFSFALAVSAHLLFNLHTYLVLLRIEP
jgi:hypothetical protein